MAERQRRRTTRRLNRKAVVAGTAGAVLLIGGAGTAAHAALATPAAYRLATATTGTADAALTEVGTLQPVNESTVAFPIAGKLATVNVQPGQQVTAGQLLATLDPTALTAQLATAQANVANATAKLAADQAGQNSTTTPAAYTTASTAHITTVALTTAPAATSGAAGGAGSTGGGTANPIPALQQTLLTDQHTTDLALAQARTALAAATAACRPVAAPPPPHQPAPKPTTTPPATHPSPTATAHPTTTSPTVHPAALTPAAPTSGQSTCSTAEVQALSWETTSYQDEQTVAADEAALDTALGILAANPATGTGGAHTPTGSTGAGSATKSGTHASTSGSGGSHGAAPVTAAQLAADQAAVDATDANQQAAQQNLDQTKLLSPEAGTVTAVGFAAADQITAGSTTQTIVISSPGGEQVTVNVPVTSLASVTQGERATVIPDGSITNLTGTVTAIAVLPTSTTTPTYPVTIVLTGGTNLPNGATATVSLIAANNGTTVIVPTTAITSTGRGNTVRVDNHGKLTTVPVTIGATGPIYTQITTGLTAGQQVVIADLTAPLPTTTTATRGLTGGAGGAGSGGGGRGGN